MSTAEKAHFVSVEEYFTGEQRSQVKHEYLGGYVYALVGARVAHDIIAGNVFGNLHSRLRGKRCRPFTSDMKIQIKLPTHVRFYYPDASAVCRQNAPDEFFQDEPVVV